MVGPRALRMVLVITVVHVGACSAMRDSSPEGFAERAEVDGDFDRAEARWRAEIARTPWSKEPDWLEPDPLPPPDAAGVFDDRLLAADDAGEPGRVAAPDETAALDPLAAEESGWDRFGKATFATMTVLVTLGMMAAPYLLL